MQLLQAGKPPFWRHAGELLASKGRLVRATTWECGSGEPSFALDGRSMDRMQAESHDRHTGAGVRLGSGEEVLRLARTWEAGIGPILPASARQAGGSGKEAP